MISKIKIALADDEMLIREGIKAILGQEDIFEVLFDVSNGIELIDYLENNPNNLPEIVLMDINMPEYNGVEATEFIHSKFPEILIVALSSYTSTTFMKQMFSVGAVCYIPKNFSPIDLIYRIKKVHENGFYYENSFLSFIKNNVNSLQFIASEEISERELQVLKLICQQQSSTEIAQKLHISPRTVDGHRNSLLAKTDSKNIVGLVVYAIQNKLFLPEIKA
jgi:DNA-binding NarL/FixJ family response regulator